MEPALIAHLATLGYKITNLQGEEYGCTRLDGIPMNTQECSTVATETQKWLVRRYYH